MADDYLHIYLNDHLAGSTGGLELARRVAESNEDNPLGESMAQMATEFEAERDELQRLMDELGVSRNPIKVAGAFLGEKLARLKANGQLVGYSPLSRVLELEMLHMGITGKLQLWGALREVFGPRLGDFDFERLIEQAKSQRDRVEEHRLAVAPQAFGESVQSAKAAVATPQA